MSPAYAAVLDTEAAEEAAFDDLTPSRIARLQASQRFIKGEQVVGPCFGHEFYVLQRNPLPVAPAFLCLSLDCVIDQDSAHGPCCDGEEMRPVLPGDPVQLHELEVGFVHQGHRIERMVATLGAQVSTGDLA